MDWIDLAQDRDRWWTSVNAVTDFRVAKSEGKFVTEYLLAAQEGDCSLELVSCLIG